jgi:hypothetical protein
MKLKYVLIYVLIIIFGALVIDWFLTLLYLALLAGMAGVG